ncbi:V-set and transmembrane domain-containing protein 4 isoform X2 [Myotis myotis]|uniref:V-set and transmembrane domain containing 4 n=1 Tax=Myotis myotis TaxID=51298 RepID=A0A7J7RMW6_MYOMY|nr:V-set and transmembrane domain-containing protein 4 isoform X2 [Myotis myotis]KAF6277469.1 V-set and transmembrane domain containing 4 [Myotis myotis]
MRLLALAAAALLARAPAPDLCGALNVTVSPGPVADFLEGDNATLLCRVSQKRWGNSLLAVRWFFGRPNSKVSLMVRRSKHGAVKYYGKFHNSSYQQRLRLREQRQGRLHNYSLSVLTLRSVDQGHYVCKVQEIIQQRKRWTILSNSSAETELRVIPLKASEDSSFGKTGTWAFFAVRKYLVKCPQNSSGETVTSVTSLAPLQPKKGKRRKEKADVPPEVPAKAPTAATPHKLKLLKPQRRDALPRIAEENLTYAELELTKPPRMAKGIPTSTVYAQILFQENTL